MSTDQSTGRKILILGAGELGLCVIKELSAIIGDEAGKSISVLLPPPKKVENSEAQQRHSTVRALGANILNADLAVASVDELASIFSSFEQIIGCTGFVGGPGTQKKSLPQL